MTEVYVVLIEDPICDPFIAGVFQSRNDALNCAENNALTYNDINSLEVKEMEEFEYYASTDFGYRASVIKAVVQK
jgi:hypothetical protein